MVFVLLRFFVHILQAKPAGFLQVWKSLAPKRDSFCPVFKTFSLSYRSNRKVSFLFEKIFSTQIRQILSYSENFFLKLQLKVASFLPLWKNSCGQFLLYHGKFPNGRDESGGLSEQFQKKTVVKSKYIGSKSTTPATMSMTLLYSIQNKRKVKHSFPQPGT